MTLTFADGTNLDSATSDVRDATARIAGRFPDGVDPPVIVKADANAQAIMQLSVTSDTLTRDDLTNLVDNQISQALSAVPGVADLQIYGEQAKVFTIDVDQNKLASLGLTVGNIQTALSSIAFDTAAGTINGANQNISVRALADVTTPADFENIIINGKTRLGDVATVVFGPQNSSSGLHSDGKSGIGIGIIRAAQSNTIQISAGVNKAIDPAAADAAQGRRHQDLERRLDLHLGRPARGRALARPRSRHRHRRHLPLPDGLARDARPRHLDAGRPDRRHCRHLSLPAFRSTS